MIKYNVNNMNNFLHHISKESKEIKLGFIATDLANIYDFKIGEVYYGVFNRQFTAFKVDEIYIHSKYESCLALCTYMIHLPNGECYQTHLNDDNPIFDKKENLVRYIQTGLYDSRMEKVTLKSFFANKFNDAISARDGILTIPNLYYFNNKMERKICEHVEFSFICIDNKGLHYAASSDYDGFKLYTSYEECEKERLILHDFGGNELIGYVEMKEDELYYLRTKDGDSIIFIKDDNMNARTSCKCYIYDPDVYEDEDELRGVCESGTLICDDDEIDSLEVASEYKRRLFKANLEKEIKSKEECVELDANYIEHIKKFL